MAPPLPSTAKAEVLTADTECLFNPNTDRFKLGSRGKDLGRILDDACQVDEQNG